MPAETIWERREPRKERKKDEGRRKKEADSLEMSRVMLLYDKYSYHNFITLSMLRHRSMTCVSIHSVLWLVTESTRLLSIHLC